MSEGALAGLRRRWPWRRAAAAEAADAQGGAAGVYVDWQALLGLEFAARRVRWPPQQASARSLLAGRHRSRVRGRGLDFIELRHYLPGDDTRSIDWRASARTGHTHVRVYAEERDRPTWLVADQRLSMFFARSGSLRSVVAAEAAAVWGWRALSGGDRVGGLVISDEGLDETLPGRGRRSLLQFLEQLRRRNHALRAESAVPPAPAQLDAALQRLLRHAPRQAVIAVFSDFDGLGEGSRSLLLELARHNDLVLLPIWEDPRSTTPGARLVVSDGRAQLPIDHGDRKVIEGLARLAHERSERLRGLRSELGCAVLPLLNTEPALLQLARGLDQTPPTAARL